MFFLLKNKISLILIAALIFTSGCTSSHWKSSYREALRLIDENAPMEKILEQLNLAIREEPDNLAHLSSRAHLYFDKGDYDLAIADFNNVLKKNPGDSYTLYLRALANGKLNHLDAAFADCRKAIELNPQSDQYHAGLSLCFIARKNYSDALKEIDKAIALAPRFQRWHYMRGMILSLQGNKAAAENEFESTIVFTKSRSSGAPEEIHFNGEVEYQRCTKLQQADLGKLWHYGGQWEPDGVREFYAPK